MGKDEAEGQPGQGSFGAWLADAISRAGYSTPTHFARRAGVDPSVVMRWISNEKRPTVRLLERVAPFLRKDVTELVSIAYGDTPAVPVEPRPLHPLAVELGAMLADDSPLPEDRRTQLAALVDAVMAQQRPLMPRRRRRSA